MSYFYCLISHVLFQMSYFKCRISNVVFKLLFRLQGWKWPSVQGCEREQLPSCLSGDCSLDESGIRSKMLNDSTGGSHLGWWLGCNHKLFIIILSKHFISLFRSYPAEKYSYQIFSKLLEQSAGWSFPCYNHVQFVEKLDSECCIFICTWFLSH